MEREGLDGFHHQAPLDYHRFSTLPPPTQFTRVNYFPQEQRS